MSNSDPKPSAESRWDTEFVLAKTLGLCNGGVRYKATNKRDNAFYEVKKLQLGSARKQSMFNLVPRAARGSHTSRELFQEARIWRQVDGCPFIQRFYNVWTEDTTGYLQLEYLPGGTVGELDDSRKLQESAAAALSDAQRPPVSRWSEVEVVAIIECVGKALATIHRTGFYHGSLDRNSIYVSAPPADRTPQPLTTTVGALPRVPLKFKLGNFSRAVSLRQVHDLDLSYFQDMPMMDPVVYPKKLCPPELQRLLHAKHGAEKIDLAALDVYCFAVLLLHLMTPHVLFLDLDHSCLPHPTEHPLLHAVLRQMLQPDPTNRPTAAILVDVVKFFRDRSGQTHARATAQTHQYFASRVGQPEASATPTQGAVVPPVPPKDNRPSTAPKRRPGTAAARTSMVRGGNSAASHPTPQPPQDAMTTPASSVRPGTSTTAKTESPQLFSVPPLFHDRMRKPRAHRPSVMYTRCEVKESIRQHKNLCKEILRCDALFPSSSPRKTPRRGVPATARAAISRTTSASNLPSAGGTPRHPAARPPPLAEEFVL